MSTQKEAATKALLDAHWKRRGKDRPGRNNPTKIL